MRDLHDESTCKLCLLIMSLPDSSEYTLLYNDNG